MKNLFLFICSFTLLASCSKDVAKEVATSAEITLKSSSDVPISGITVYAYDQTTWEMIDDNSLFANSQSTSTEAGKAVFSI